MRLSPSAEFHWVFQKRGAQSLVEPKRRWGWEAVALLAFAMTAAGCTGQSANEGCVFNGVSYAEGEAFDAPDGCNQCVCGGEGAITCTEVDACRVVPRADGGQPEPEPEPTPTPEAEPEPAAEPEAEPAVEPDVAPEAEDAGVVVDAGEPDAPPDGGNGDDDAGIPGPPTCEVPQVGIDGCACGYEGRPSSVGGETETFEAACAARPFCESSCCPAGFRPDANAVQRCIPDDSIPPTIAVGATSFAGPGPTWSFEVRAASYGADRCRVTGSAGDRSYDFVGGAYVAVSFTSPNQRYDLEAINLTFLCENAFGLAIDRFAFDAAPKRLTVTPTSEGSPFRGLVCLEDLFTGPCSVAVCADEAVVDEDMPLGGECTGGYVVTLNMPGGPRCAPVDALVLGEQQELLAQCEGPDGFTHAFKAPMLAALGGD